MEAHQNKLTAGDIKSFLLNAYFGDTSEIRFIQQPILPILT